METYNPSAHAPAPACGPELAPITTRQRIQALDVVRGFALIGICIMNVEFFNRAQVELGSGIPFGVTGLHWWASWFSNYFIAGKFWTIFSLLFGMGFAVMLSRAKESGRDFLLPYVRRIAALGVLGALHHILLWPGDILFSYAVGAVVLLFTLFGNWKIILASMLAVIGFAFLIHVPNMNSYAFALGLGGLLAIYMRHDRIYTRLNLSLPLFSWIFTIVASLLVMAEIASWIVPAMKEMRLPLGVASSVTTLIALLSAKYFKPDAARIWRAGVGIFVLPFVIGLLFTSAEYFNPAPQSAVAKVEAAKPAASAAKAGHKADTKAAAKVDTKADTKAADPKAERAAKRAERVKERAAEAKNEIKVLTTGSYADAVKMRATAFVKHVPHEGGFASALLGMFLLGTWFVRSGVMNNTAAHLPLFRKLAFIALPLGLAVSLGSSMMASSHVAGAIDPTWDLASVLLQLSSLPVCLGYVSMIILMMHSSGPLAKVSVLGAFGRMALTNYLMQSVIASAVFYHYGLGLFGVGRAWQFGYVALLIPVQIAFSHWWLARFAYGPMEWAWRAVTYWQIPALRLQAAPVRMSALQAARMVA